MMILARLVSTLEHSTCRNIEVVQICGREENVLTVVMSNNDV